MRHVRRRARSLSLPVSLSARDGSLLSSLFGEERNQFAGAVERHDMPRRGRGVCMAGRREVFLPTFFSIDSIFPDAPRIRLSSIREIVRSYAWG